MDWQFNGLPLHVLLVHFVVVAVPLAALCLLLATFWPAARRRLGIVTPLIALAALISVPITVQAGEWLEERVAETPLVEEHTEMGESLLPWSIAVFLIAALQWAWFRYVAEKDARYATAVRSTNARRAIVVALAVGALIASVGSVVAAVQIGESGVRSVWSNSFTQGEQEQGEQEEEEGD